MNIENKYHLHSIIGGMTTDYFDFFCQKCGEHIDRVDFYSLDIVGVQLVAQCPKCGESSIFKIKTSIPLGPIRFTGTIYKHSFKAYDQRKLKKYKNKIERKIAD